ncbi:MAG: sulfite exporter TauE/SafE family protein [candidate division Zixibacteria bacterium]|nr:sulfite exporter TauE/SafE family protein [candidate division Zixibacteria bacterium]
MELSMFLLPILGIFVGVMVTFIGGGGGAVYIPLLMFFLGCTLREAVPISLATMVITSFVGSISHYRHGNVQLKGAAIAVLGALIGTGLGTYISTISPESILERAFGVLMLIMIFPMYLEIKDKKRKALSKEFPHVACVLDNLFEHGYFLAIMIFIIGLVSGTFTGIFGVSGVATLIVGFYLIKVRPKIIVGTSVFILFFKALSGLLWHLPTADINWEVVILLGLGTSIGGFLGPGLLSKIHHEKAENMLDIVFICIIAGLGILFLVKPV